MSPLRRFAWPATVLAALGAVALARAGGHLDFLDFEVRDARARVLQREVATDIVVVGIDAHSLEELQAWPWPRRHHAALLDRLALAEPQRVFVDIDFSARAGDEDDARLEAALASWPHAPVVLPAFFQQASGADPRANLSIPQARFARHASLASVNQVLAADGRVRSFRAAWHDAGRTVPSAVATLFGHDLPPGDEFPIDYSISPASFAFISYSDLLAGRVAPAELRGKTVLVGATALELNDIISTPVHRALPGVVVQALALESARQGIPLRAPEWLYLAVLAGVAVLTASVCRGRGWRAAGAIVAGELLLLVAAFMLLPAAAIDFELAPLALVVGAVFLLSALRALDEQTLRALGYALGLRRRDALLRSVVDSSTDCILSADASGVIQIANVAASRLFGREPASLIGTPLAALVPVIGDLQARAGSVFETEAAAADGGLFAVELSVSQVELADERLYTAIVRDVRERKAQQRELEYRATHDALTSLPNRTALAAHLQQTLEACAADAAVALLMLDLCRFKEVNDTLGHDVGDQVLQEVARRFRDALPAHGFLARIGGDEFTVVLAPCDDARAKDAARDLAAALHRPIEAQGVALDIGVSIGIARFPHDAHDAQILLRRADVAMYVSKRAVSPYEIYDESRDAHSVRRLAMVARLRAALGGDELSLKYQPKISLRSGRAESVEALLRWQHPTLGAVGPAEFMPLVESTDLVRPVTEWTIVEALEQSERWRRQGLGLRVAVNLSARMLQDADFPARLRNLLARSQALPGSIELEITESAMMIDLDRALRAIRDMSNLGVPITIDDYGTGFSSLAYLRDLPVHALKLDRSFVTDLEKREDNRVIVASTVLMAHALELEVVAEGVETDWAASYLIEAGCDHAQGFLYAPALAADECLDWIRRYNARQRRPQAVVSAHPRSRVSA
jgi:diguanylate cyclase (GGDEF)-like protein/PAS domain S-box-containing protein